MNENQKYGLLTIIISCLLIILSLMISVGWNSQPGFLDNLMDSLAINEFEYIRTNTATYNSTLNPNSEEYTYLIDIPTKYVVLFFMSTAAHGPTTYLGITKAFRPWK